MRSAATSPSTRSSTTSGRSRSSTTSAASKDLDRRLIRCIGDPEVRFLEDPVRMLRAVVLAARLEFTIDEPILDAIKAHRHEIARSAPARLVEEFYKILRSGTQSRRCRQLRRDRPAQGDHAGAGRRRGCALGVRRRARSLSRPVRGGAGVADQRDPRGHALQPLGLLRVASASPPIRSSVGSSWGCCRSRGATRAAPSDHAAAAAPARHRAQARARNAACCTARCSTRR